MLRKLVDAIDKKLSERKRSAVGILPDAVYKTMEELRAEDEAQRAQYNKTEEYVEMMEEFDRWIKIGEERGLGS